MPSDEILLVCRLLNRLGLVPVQVGSAARLVNADGYRVEHAGGVWRVTGPEGVRRVVMREARDTTTGTTLARRILPEGHPDAVWDEMIGEYLESDESMRRRILGERAGEPGDGPNLQ